MIRRFPFVAAAIVFGAISLSSASAATGPTYSELVAKAERDGLSINYTDLRLAYAASDGADLWGNTVNKDIEPMIKSAQAGDCDKALGYSDKVIKSEFIDILAHMVRSECFDSKGELALSAREDTIVAGLRDSIFGSGDGKSEKSAFVVVTLDEEEFVLSSLGLHESQQALLKSDGHSYDAIDASDEKGAKSTVFFQIDVITAAEQKAFGGKP